MSAPDGSVDKIIEALQERAKELHCLYRVHELINRPDASLDEIGRGLLDVIPPGWQYPDVCWARVTLNNLVYEPPQAIESPWAQRAPIVVDEEVVGAIEVFYRRRMPDADEGPFLKEERKLIDTIAERLAHFLTQQRLQSALQSREWAAPKAPAAPRPEWWVIVEFLRQADHHLLIRIARRMINYLAWSGVAEAQELLQRFVGGRGVAAEAGDEANRPQEKRNLDELLGVTEEAFRIAAERLSEREILSSIQKWIKDDRAAFLVEAVESQRTSLPEIVEALDRFRHLGIADHELSRAVQVGLRVALVRRLLTDNLDFLNIAKNYIAVGDFYDLVHHVIGPTGGHGRLGGKSAGLFLAAQIVRQSREYAEALGSIKVPRTWYVTSDGILSFIQHNHFEDLHNWKYREIDQSRREYPHLVQVFKNSRLPPEIVTGLSLVLGDFADRPLIVRSSSLLEDQSGSAFSGKYKSLFLANQGSKSERLAQLMDAIAEVYASLFGPDPIEYRAERGLLDLHEEMAVMIQEVVGTRVGRYFMPAYSGVAFSNNEVRWSARIRREDGLVRLVPGLGTRAVDRLSDDYPVMVAPGQPGLRVNVAPDEVARYAPRRIDVINLEAGRFETIEIADLLREFGREYPSIDQIASIYDRDGIHPLGPLWHGASHDLVITFEGLVAGTPFMARMRALLRVLREKMGAPVDVEFASDGHDFYLLQCRPQSYGEDAAPAPIPRDLPAERVIFTANRYVSNGRLRDMTHIVYVDPERYGSLGDLTALRDVGRAVGRLNRLLPKRQFVLMGPGRWGSRGDIRLGVSVTYADISNAALLIEIARKHGQYVPDVSFGTHFFQDLVEAGIRYVPLFPDDPAVRFNEPFLRGSPNLLPEILPEYRHLADTLRVLDVTRITGGLVLRVLMNADLDEAVGLLAAPSPDAAVPAKREVETPLEDHWQWRLRMAERLAAEADAARFGIRAMYVFGSTKNGTAGPSSDIDLLVHFDGTEEMRRALEVWLEGWSLCLGEMNYLRTGYRGRGLLDVHIVTNEDIARQTSYAAKIGSVTDAARPLALRE